jgi:hypothetical protein
MDAVEDDDDDDDDDDDTRLICTAVTLQIPAAVLALHPSMMLPRCNGQVVLFVGTDGKQPTGQPTKRGRGTKYATKILARPRCRGTRWLPLSMYQRRPAAVL